MQTLGGKTLRLKVPPATQNGQVFRLKGHGMPTAGKPDRDRDLYATVDVQLPRELTPEQRATSRRCGNSTRSSRGSLRTPEASRLSRRSEARSPTRTGMNLNKYTREGPGSRHRGAAARRPIEPRADRARAPARGPGRAAGRRRAGSAPEDVGRPGGDRRAARASCSRKIPQAYGGSQPGLSPRLKTRDRPRAGRSRAAEGRVRQHRAPVHRRRVRDRPLPCRPPAHRARADHATRSSPR